MQIIRRAGRNKWFLSSATVLALIEVVGAGGKWF